MGMFTLHICCIFKAITWVLKSSSWLSHLDIINFKLNMIKFKPNFNKLWKRSITKPPPPPHTITTTETPIYCSIVTKNTCWWRIFNSPKTLKPQIVFQYSCPCRRWQVQSVWQSCINGTVDRQIPVRNDQCFYLGDSLRCPDWSSPTGVSLPAGLNRSKLTVFINKSVYSWFTRYWISKLQSVSVLNNSNSFLKGYIKWFRGKPILHYRTFL